MKKNRRFFYFSKNWNWWLSDALTFSKNRNWQQFSVSRFKEEPSAQQHRSGSALGGSLSS
jgi:hypothetical protein